jgi:hypothetical protein
MSSIYIDSTDLLNIKFICFNLFNFFYIFLLVSSFFFLILIHNNIPIYISKWLVTLTFFEYV